MKYLIDLYRHGLPGEKYEIVDNKEEADKIISDFVTAEHDAMVKNGFDPNYRRSSTNGTTTYVYVNNNTTAVDSFGYKRVDQVDDVDYYGNDLFVYDCLLPIWAVNIPDKHKRDCVQCQIQYDSISGFYLYCNGINYPIEGVNFQGFVKVDKSVDINN